MKAYSMRNSSNLIDMVMLQIVHEIQLQPDEFFRGPGLSLPAWPGDIEVNLRKFQHRSSSQVRHIWFGRSSMLVGKIEIVQMSN